MEKLDNATGYRKLIAMDIESLKKLLVYLDDDAKDLEYYKKVITDGIEYSKGKIEITEEEGKEELLREVNSLLDLPRKEAQKVIEMLKEYGIDIYNYQDKLDSLGEEKLEEIHKKLASSNFDPMDIKRKKLIASKKFYDKLDKIIIPKLDSVEKQLNDKQASSNQTQDSEQSGDGQPQGGQMGDE